MIVISGLAATGKHGGNGNCQVIVAAEALGLTRNVVYDEGQRGRLLRRYQCRHPHGTG